MNKLDGIRQKRAYQAAAIAPESYHQKQSMARHSQTKILD